MTTTATVTVLGASGHTGKVTAHKLLDAGIQVRAVGRSADKLADLVKRGAQPVIADVNDVPVLTAAFKGADAVYGLVPPNFATNDVVGFYESVTSNIAQAVEASGVKKVVFLSSMGAQVPAGNGPIAGLYRAEQRLKQVPGIDVLFLRAGYFFENMFSSLGLIKHKGINGGAIEPDVAFPQVATADIAAVAADALIKRDFTGVSVREVMGQRDLSMREATRILGQKIGKPDLAYVRFPDEAFAGALQEAGFSAHLAGKFVEMAHAISSGKAGALAGRNTSNTTPTSFDSFADQLAAAYRQL